MPSRHLQRRAALGAGLVCGLFFLLAPSVAGAGVKDSKGRFVFEGLHYEERNFDNGTLPINVIFRGGTQVVRPLTVAAHMEDSWPGWAVRDRDRCTVTRYLPYQNPSRSRASFAAPAMYGSTNSTCGNQRHARFFDDTRHSQLFDHTTIGHFMPLQMHGEEYVYEWKCFGILPRFCVRDGDHKIVEDYDTSRIATLRRMGRGAGAHHYVDFDWQHHPTAYAMYGNRVHSRLIGRVSMAHVP